MYGRLCVLPCKDPPGRPVASKDSALVLIAFHKPYGVLSQFTPDGSPNRPLAEFGLPQHVYPIGRLDADSEGLLLLSDEPEWNARLLEPRHAHAREYWAQVERIPAAAALEQLARGVLVQGRKTLPCRAWRLDPQPVVQDEIPSPGLTATLSTSDGERLPETEISRLEPLNRGQTFNAQHPTSNLQGRTFRPPRDVGSSMLNVECSQGFMGRGAPTIPQRIPPIRFRKSVPDCWIGLELIEGKNRQVRRMTAAIGHPTLRLIRVRIGRLTLADQPPGTWRILPAADRNRVAGDCP
jgi:pseudouridine synthase